jgi:PTH1 family peptidyl-tRNA hydrolase
MYIAVGLGNPGEQYEKTRHNTGRMTLAYAEENLSPKILKQVKFLIPDTFMNKSGSAVTKVVKSKKAAQKLVVIYDDLDLPLGTMKISFDRSSGGHRGLESVIKALKTREFVRIRIGISPTTPTGKLKKPKTEKDVEKFILGEFKPAEIQVLKKVFKKATEALEVIVTDGHYQAMNEFN